MTVAKQKCKLGREGTRFFPLFPFSLLFLPFAPLRSMTLNSSLLAGIAL